MKAITVKLGKVGVEIKDIELKQIKNKIKVRTISTGICGTDREIVYNELNFVKPEEGDYLILGHEALGIIEESIENSIFKEGDLVVPMVRRPGNCKLCKIGRQDYCLDGNFIEAGIRGKNGFMCEYFYEDEKYLVKINKSIQEYAVLVEPLKNVMKIVEVFNFLKNRVSWECDDSTYSCKGAWIFGTGPEGILISLVFKSLGLITTIVNRHPLPTNILDFLDINGIEFFNSSSDDWSKKLKDYPMDVAIDAAGTTEIFNQIIENINNNGIIILFGTKGSGSIEKGEFITKIVDKNLSIAGSEDGSKLHYIQASNYLENYAPKQNIKNLITGIYKPEDIWILKEKPKDEIKSIIKWS
jgi:threonine dehydrogenase-like Zn-dependent dehydrogenase